MIRPLLARLAVGLDVAIRCAVIVVCWFLVREFWGEPGPGSDGFPAGMLVPFVIAYGAWNVWMIVRSGQAWISHSIHDHQLLGSIGLLSLARLVWLLPLADDLWWHHRDRLIVLVVASVACTVLAFAASLTRSVFTRTP